MRILKYLFFIILILFIAGSVYFSLKDGSYSITEEKIIEAPASVIYEELADFKAWDSWNPWTKKEGITSTMGDVTAGTGGNYSFTDEYGTGKMEFTSVAPDENITAQMNYDAGITQSESVVTMNLEPVENGTKVIWNITGEDGFKNKIMNAILGLDLEKEIRPMYVEGLNNLERVVEEKMNLFEISDPKIVSYGGGYIIFKSISSSISNIDKSTEPLFKDLEDYMINNEIDTYGSKMMVYEKMDMTNNSAIVSAAIPTKENIVTTTDTGILSTLMEPVTAVKVELKGKRKHVNDAWLTATDHIAQNELNKSDKPMFIIYENEASQVDNPSNLKTSIYIPISTND